MVWEFGKMPEVAIEIVSKLILFIKSDHAAPIRDHFFYIFRCLLLKCLA